MILYDAFFLSTKTYQILRTVQYILVSIVFILTELTYNQI